MYYIVSNLRLYNKNYGEIPNQENLNNFFNKKGKTMDSSFYFGVEEAELYKALLYSSPDAIVIYDLKGKVIFINSIFTDIFGFTLEEIRGRKIPFVPEEELEQSLKIIKDILEKDMVCHGFETKRFKKNGEIIDISISASKINNKDGKPIGILVVLRDITDRNKLKERVVQMERIESIGRLAGGIAHDFNNLLMGMQGNVDLLKLKLIDTDKWNSFEKYINALNKLIDSGQKLTNQLLGYARKGKYQLKILNLNLIIKNIVFTFERTKKQIEIQLRLDNNLKKIKADEGQMEQVIYNILINAADAMRDRGKIIIETKLFNASLLKDKLQEDKIIAEEYVFLSIEDNGKGMDKETLKYIFDPFFTTKKHGNVKGTGLGLASVYGIIEAHNGFIEVESIENKGSKFMIYLPVYDKNSIEYEEPTVTFKKIEELEKRDNKVLIVDDEENILESTKELLQFYNYDVYICKNGLEAIELLKDIKNEINFAIIDMIMPDIHGSELLKKLRSIKPNLKAIISTGYTVDDTIREMFGDELVEFLQKPYDMETLFTVIKKIEKPDASTI